MLKTDRVFLATALHGQGRWAAAHELFKQSLEEERRTGTRADTTWILLEIGRAECDEDRPDLALRHFVEGITIAMGIGKVLDTIELLEGIANVAAATGAPIRAARLWGAADALRQQDGFPRSIRDSMIVDRHVRPVHDALTRDEFDQAWNQGRAMSLQDAVRLAMADLAHPDA